jgi:hypothetical protein
MTIAIYGGPRKEAGSPRIFVADAHFHPEAEFPAGGVLKKVLYPFFFTFRAQSTPLE